MSLKTDDCDELLLLFANICAKNREKCFRLKHFAKKTSTKKKDNFAVNCRAIMIVFFILFMIYFLSVPLCTRFLFIHLSVMFMYDVLLFIIYEKSMKKS